MKARILTVIVAVAVGAAVACGGSSGNGVTFSARTGAASGGGGTALRSALTIGDVTVDRIQLVIRSVRLERLGAADGGTDGGVDGGADGGVDGGADGGVDGGDDGGVDGGSGLTEEELSVGPFLIDLAGSALDSGRVTSVFDASNVPSGTYRKIKFKIHKLEDGDTSFPGFPRKSLVVTGTFRGAPFTFDSEVNEEQEREGSFAIGNGNDNITLNIDVSRWFAGAGGTTLDPTLSSDRKQIEDNIKSSIDAYDDDDRDGRR
jgi:hypothetical protein